MATIDWQRFFTLPLPELLGDLVDLNPSRGGVPGITLPRAKAIRKLTILTLWPAVQGDREREQALLVCCNAHEQANWWVRAGTVGAPRSIADQLGWLLALRAGLQRKAGQAAARMQSGRSTEEEPGSPPWDGR